MNTGIDALQFVAGGVRKTGLSAALKNVIPAMINYEFINLSLTDRLESCRLLAGHGYRLLHTREDTLAVCCVEQKDGNGR